MIEFMLSLFISLFFFILITWIVTNEAINRGSYSFKLKSVLVTYIASTIVILFFFILDKSLLFMFLGYGMGMVVAELINQIYFDKRVVKRLDIRSRIPLQDPEEIFNQIREKVQNNGEKTS